MNPWEYEPNRLEFRSHGFDCLILRVNHSGHLCGYVGLTEDHPAYGLDYDAEMLRPIQVHGGLTFAGKGDGEYRPANRWWLGFDCAHFGDYCPVLEQKYGAAGLLDAERHTIYRDIGYVRHETERLAEQLAALSQVEELGHA